MILIYNPHRILIGFSRGRAVSASLPAGVTQALKERLERVRHSRSKRGLADDLDEIALHCAALPVHDRRSADEIMRYDEHGLPG